MTNVNNLYKVVQEGPPTTSGKATPSQPVAVSRPFAHIEPLPLKWLWPCYIPLGKVTILDGDPGLGKSTMLLDLAARISTNGQMPDSSQGEVGDVLVTSAEDGAEDTMHPRLVAAHADLAHVHNLEGIDAGKGAGPTVLPEDLPAIEELIQKHSIRLWIIDPFMALLSGEYKSHSDHDIRRALYPLSQLAQRQACAVICLRHLNKSSMQKALYRGGASIGIIGAGRAGLLIAEDPADDQYRVLAVTKCNLSAKPPSLRFQLHPLETGFCQVHWCGESDFTADELVNPPSATKSNAYTWLLAHLPPADGHSEQGWTLQEMRDEYAAEDPPTLQNLRKAAKKAVDNGDAIETNPNKNPRRYARPTK